MRSKYFDLKDVESVDLAKRHGVKNNQIPHDLLTNAQGLAQEILDPMVEAVGQNGVVIISNWYRNDKLNKRVGGVPGSHHMTGRAVDIDMVGNNQKGFKSAIRSILNSGKYDEFIVSINESGEVVYLHVTWSDVPKKELLLKDYSDEYKELTVLELLKYVNR